MKEDEEVMKRINRRRKKMRKGSRGETGGGRRGEEDQGKGGRRIGNKIKGEEEARRKQRKAI